MPELTALEVLLAIARSGSLSAADRDVGLGAVRDLLSHIVAAGR
jgi:hypothetical protein